MSDKIRDPFCVVKNSRGESLITVMIGAALLMVVAILVTSLPTIKSTTAKLMGTDVCQARANEIVSAFTVNANKLEVSNWHPTAADPSPPPYSSGQPRLPSGYALTPGLGVAMTAANSYPWALVDASYNWLAQYYNTNPSICSVAGDGMLLASGTPYFFTAPFKISTTSQLPSETIYLNVQRENIMTHAIDCTMPALLVPINSANVGTTFPAGLKITAKVTYTTNEGANKSCSASTVLKPDADNAPPGTAPIGQLLANTTLNPVPGACGTSNPVASGPEYCLCQNGICMSIPCNVGDPNCNTYGGPMGTIPGYTSYTSSLAKPFSMNASAGLPAVCADSISMRARLNFSILSSEPATLYSCSINSVPAGVPPPGPGGIYNNCNAYAVGPMTGTLSRRNPAGVGAAGTTGVYFEAQNIPVGNHTMTFQGLDSALNVGNSSVNFAVVDPCPAAWTSRVCSGNPMPNICWEPNKCTGTKVVGWCPDPDSQPCGTPLINECGFVCGAGRAPIFSNDASFMGTDADACGNCSVTGTCTVATPSDPPCPVRNCVGPMPPPPDSSCEATAMNCPTLQTADPAGTFGTTATQTGGVASYRFVGGSVGGGCTMDFIGAQDPNAATPGTQYGTVPIPGAVEPSTGAQMTPTFDFGIGSPGVFTGTRDLTLTCGGNTINCRYGASCAGVTCNHAFLGCLP